MLENDEVRIFIQSLAKKKTTKKGLTIVQKNFGNFQVALRSEGIMELAALAKLNQWTYEVLTEHASIIEYIAKYHPESPRYWLKNIDKSQKTIRTIKGKDIDVEVYSVGLDLEQFMESKKAKSQRNRTKQLGFYIPDNYELAQTVLKEYGKKNDIKNIDDNSYREFANWESTNLSSIKSLATFLENNYTLTKLRKIMKAKGIVKCVFTKDNKLDFIYKK
jgi:hypothetical protein